MTPTPARELAARHLDAEHGFGGRVVAAGRAPARRHPAPVAPLDHVRHPRPVTGPPRPVRFETGVTHATHDATGPRSLTGKAM